MNNPKGSSLDLFSYLHWERSGADSEPLAEEFLLSECTPEDFEILKTFYDISSGGLLMASFGLHLPANPLKASFYKAGFRRNYRTFCLCRGKKHLAFFIVNQSRSRIKSLGPPERHQDFCSGGKGIGVENRRDGSSRARPITIPRIRFPCWSIRINIFTSRALTFPNNISSGL